MTFAKDSRGRPAPTQITAISPRISFGQGDHLSLAAILPSTRSSFFHDEVVAIFHGIHPCSFVTRLRSVTLTVL
jgi:hypothetical protein